MSALSLSTTMTTSPADTLSPSLTAHCTILPSFIVEESAGIRIEGPSGASTAGAAGAASAGVAAAAGAAPPAAATESISPSVSAMRATVEPTGADEPSGTRILARKPSSKASTSMSALSLSTTMMTSPADTLSPTSLVHCTILPSFMVEERAGMSTLIPDI